MSDEKKEKPSKAEALRNLYIDLEAQRLQEEGESMTKEELRAKAAGTESARDEAFANIENMIEEAKHEEAKPEVSQSEQPQPLPENVVDIRTARRARNRLAAIVGGVSLFAGSVAAAAGVPLYMAANNLQMVARAEVPVPLPPVTAGAAPGTPRADDLRARAYAECFGSDYGQCLQDLDEAKGLDPEGDQIPSVINARKYAKRWMQPK